jgi:HPt (histidine-containing phosphotransfer) domain-containing protein
MDIEKAKKDAMEALGIDEELFDELAGIFMGETEESIVTLDAAFEAGDFETVRGEAHKIRGGAGNLRIEEIQSLAAVLESACEDGGDRDLIRKDADLLKSAVAELKDKL